MTPITITGPKGTFAVRQARRFAFAGMRFVETDTSCYAVECDVWRCYFNTLPMALRHAAELAGVKRMRVAFNPETREVEATCDGEFFASVRLALGESATAESMTWHLNWLGNRAHEYASRRYAAAVVTA